MGLDVPGAALDRGLKAIFVRPVGPVDLRGLRGPRGRVGLVDSFRRSAPVGLFFALGCMVSLDSVDSVDSEDPEDSLAFLVSASLLGSLGLADFLDFVDFGADPLGFVDPEGSFDPFRGPRRLRSPSSFSFLKDFLGCVDFACDSVDALRFAADSLDSLYADSVDADDSLDFAADCDNLGCLVPADFEEPPAGDGAEACGVVLP